MAARIPVIDRAVARSGSKRFQASAVTAVANALEAFPEIRHKLPLSAIAGWMVENDIEPEDLVFASASEVRTKIAILVQQNKPHIRIAA